MLYINNPYTDAWFNLAAEEYLLKNFSDDIFMLWQNEPSVIIGKHQNTAAEINEQFVRENGVRVVRRLSGGGAVYHYMVNINFTFIADAGDMESINFRLFCRPVVAALAKIGVTAEINGRNDMTIDGQKFSGNSQYLKEGRVMHHGTIMFDSNLDLVAQALHVDQEKIRAKGIASVRSSPATSTSSPRKTRRRSRSCAPSATPPGSGTTASRATARCAGSGASPPAAASRCT